MSIRDYSQKYIVINGTTNEQTAVPKAYRNHIINIDINVNDYLLLQEIQEELESTDSISIFKSYMKD